MAPSRRMQHLVPLLILVPYCAYVMSDRFSDHHERRAENDAKKAADRRKKERELGEEMLKTASEGGKGK